MFTPYKPTIRTKDPAYLGIIDDAEWETDDGSIYTFYEMCRVCGYPFGAHSGSRCLTNPTLPEKPKFYAQEININIRLL
jgi:hypothetical protein